VPGRHCTCRMAMPTDCQYVKKMTPLMHRNLASGRMGASSVLHACMHGFATDQRTCRSLHVACSAVGTPRHTQWYS
jgi:hypothetical protein